MSNVPGNHNKTFALVVIGVLFFIFGFVTWLNSVLIPFLKISCELSNQQAFLVASAFYLAYFIMAIPVSAILKKTGFVGGMSMGLMIMLIGTLMFIPAAYLREFPIFLVGLFIQGTGLTLLQTAVNPYVTLLGPVESAAKRISIMGVANKLAGAISGLILSSVLLSKSEGQINSEIAQLAQNPLTGIDQARELYLDELAQKVIGPYLLMAGILLVLALMIRLARLPEIEKQETNSRFGIRGIPAYAWLGAIAIFFYVGAEVVVADSIILYGRGLNLSPVLIKLGNAEINLLNPGYFTLYVMSGMVIGYFIGIALIPKRLSQANALKLFTLSALAFSSLALITDGSLSLFFIILLGVSNSIMWPAIWPLAIEKTGDLTQVVSALLIMGIIGGAVISPAFGFLADKFGMDKAYMILLPCYIFILFYSITGHRINKPAGHGK